MCVFNERERCQHREVDSHDQVAMNAQELFNLLDRDVSTRRVSMDEAFSHLNYKDTPKRLRDFQQDGPVPVMVKEDADFCADFIAYGWATTLRNEFDSEGKPTRKWLYDYCRFVHHTEELVGGGTVSHQDGSPCCQQGGQTYQHRLCSCSAQMAEQQHLQS